ncbi:SpoIIE family protein phosphatase [Streptomyces sp. CG1]|uniref:SpoIIE family protein phosphatase n=1 Tax=Streptomyces sp. CG1 TaxID=1287523 RepID=UPI0034E221E3
MEEPPGRPALGLGMPFETVELEPAEVSELVLYRDGLVEDRFRDIDTRLDALRTVPACADRSPEDTTCEAVLDALLPTRPADDVALLGCTRAMGPPSRPPSRT